MHGSIALLLNGFCFFQIDFSNGDKDYYKNYFSKSGVENDILNGRTGKAKFGDNFAMQTVIPHRSKPDWREVQNNLLASSSNARTKVAEVFKNASAAR